MTRRPCAAPDAREILHCDRPAGHAGRHARTVTEEDGPHRYEWGAAARVRRPIELTLSPEALAVLSRLAGPGGSRSAVVERLLLDQAALLGGVAGAPR